MDLGFALGEDEGSETASEEELESFDEIELEEEEDSGDLSMDLGFALGDEEGSETASEEELESFDEIELEEEEDSGDLSMDLGFALGEVEGSETASEEELESFDEIELEEEEDSGDLSMDLGFALGEEEGSETASEEELESFDEIELEEEEDSGDLSMDLGFALGEDEGSETASEEELESFDEIELEEEDDSGDLSMDLGFALGDEEGSEAVSEGELESFDEIELEEEEDSGDLSMDLGFALDENADSAETQVTSDFVIDDTVDSEDEEIAFDESALEEVLDLSEEEDDEEDWSDGLNTEVARQESGYSGSKAAGVLPELDVLMDGIDLTEESDSILPDDEIADYVEQEGILEQIKDIEEKFSAEDEEFVEEEPELFAEIQHQSVEEEILPEVAEPSVPVPAVEPVQIKSPANPLDYFCQQIEESAYLIDEGYVNLDVQPLGEKSAFEMILDKLKLEAGSACYKSESSFIDWDFSKLEESLVPDVHPEFEVGSWEEFLNDDVLSLEELHKNFATTLLEEKELLPELEAYCRFLNREQSSIGASFILGEIFHSRGESLLEISCKNEALERLRGLERYEDELFLANSLRQSLPFEDDLIIRISKSLRSLGRTEERITFFVTVIQELLQYGKVSAADKYYKLLQEEGCQELSFLELGLEIASQLGGTEAVLSALNALSARYGERFHWLEKKSELHEAQGRYSESVLCLKKALGMTDAPVPIIEKLIRILDLQGKSEQSVQYMRQLESLAPEHPLVKARASEVLDASKQTNEQTVAALSEDQLDAFEKRLEKMIEQKFQHWSETAVLGNRSLPVKDLVPGESLSQTSDIEVYSEAKHTAIEDVPLAPMESFDEFELPKEEDFSEISTDSAEKVEDFEQSSYATTATVPMPAILEMLQSMEAKNKDFRIRRLNELIRRYSQGHQQPVEVLQELKSFMDEQSLSAAQIQELRKYGQNVAVDIQDPMLGFFWSSEFRG
jgi:hypothetical protein